MIELDASEMMLASWMGSRRLIKATFKNLTDSVGQSNGWENEIEGAAAEVAVAKHFGLFLPVTMDAFGAPDVGDWHIRSSKHENAHLRIGKKETTGKYMLVIGQFNKWRIAGWIQAEEARQEKYYRQMRADRPAKSYWIPQDDLHKVE